MKKIHFAFVALIAVLLTMPLHQAWAQSKTQITEIKSVNSFNKTIQNSKKPILVDFWASWCGPCRNIAPNVQAIAQEMSDKLKVAKFNLEQDGVETIVRRYRIESIPCLILFEDGKEISRKVGYMTKDELRSWLKKHVE